MPEVNKYCPKSKTVYWLLNGHANALQDSILSIRGWALQEQLLARRIIHFTDSEMIWECSAGLQSESGRTGHLQLMDLTRIVINRNAARLPEVRRDTGDRYIDQNINNFLKAKGVASVYWVWRQIVTDYSRRDLTRAEDKLVALSGIAKVFASRLSINPEDSYFAGLWEDTLIQDLLWRVANPSSVDTCGAAGRSRIAPSWSWASISGAVFYFFSEYQFKFESLAEVLDVSCLQTSTDPTGAVAGGSLEITGQFQCAVLEVKPRPTPCSWKPATQAFIYEPGKDEVRVFLDESLESGVYAQGYHCLVLGANADRFSGARKAWFLVVKQKGTRATDGLRIVERAGIGFLSLSDSWLLDSDFVRPLVPAPYTWAHTAGQNPTICSPRRKISFLHPTIQQRRALSPVFHCCAPNRF